jgi:LacI family transcriptional regulator
MDGSDDPPPKTFVDAVQLETRQSSDVTAIGDPEVAAAGRFIRMNACQGISVDDVAVVSRLSRRQLECRFRDSFGSSIYDEISRMRLLRVKTLLRETGLPLAEIANRTGYGYPEYLGAVFRMTEGLTPNEFRHAAVK